MTVSTELTHDLDMENIGPHKKRIKLSNKASKSPKVIKKKDVTMECDVELETKLEEKNEIKETSLSDQQEKMITELLSKKTLESLDYNSLSDIAELNPLVIEKKLSDIFKRILLEKKSNNEEKKSYELLLLNIFDACIRLRRDKKLVTLILMSLNEALTETKIKLKDINIDEMLPVKFTEKFSLSTKNMTNSQVSSIIMSFNHHLGLIFDDSDLITNQDVIILNVTSHLFIAFIEGIQIADSTWLLPVQQKFINNLMNVGKTLANLLLKIEQKSNGEKYNEKIYVYILSMTEYWEMLIGFFKHYSPDSVSNDVNTNVMEIVKKINKHINMNQNNTIKKLEFFCKFEENRIRDKSNLFHKLLKNENVFDDIDNFVELLIEKCPHGILHLDNLQLSKFASCLLKDLESATKLIGFQAVRNNKNLVTALILEVFKGIALALPEDSDMTSKKLMNKINGIDWWDGEQLCKILKYCKKQLSDPKWNTIDEDSIIKQYLKILLSLPLMHCSDQLKILMFSLVFSLKNDCPINSESKLICNDILHDITESCMFDILQYIPLNIILQDLSTDSNLIITRTLESSLTNPQNFEILKSLIKENPDNIKLEKSAIILIECLDKIKPKLKSQDDKQCVHKIEKKLQMIMRKNLDDCIDSSEKLKRLTLIIKYIATLDNKFDDVDLLKMIHSELDSLIELKKVDGLELTKEAHQFVKVILHNKANGIILENGIVKNIWALMLKKSSEDIIPSLIEATDSKMLGAVLNLLQKQTINSLKEVNDKNEKLFDNSLRLWNFFAKADMGSDRAKVRQASLIILFQSLKTAQNPYENSRENILKLFKTIIGTKHMHISEKIIDNILLITNHIINESMSINICNETLQLCSGFLKNRINVIADRLPIFLIIFKKLINYTINQSRVDTSNQHKITLLTLEINKISSALIKMKKDFARLSPYLIADIIKIYADGVIPYYVKDSIDDSIGLFLSICDQHAISLLNRVLPTSMQEIFKTLYVSYKKFNKFTGKI